MKKLAMLTVKGAVGLVPKVVRNKLKSNHKLTEFYSRSLQRSGLFYGFPSEKKRMALYETYLKQQAQYLHELTSVAQSYGEIHVLIFGVKSLSVTLDSLTQAGVKHEHICVVGENAVDESVQCALTIAEAVGDLADATRLMLLNSGDTITKKSLEVFLKCDSDADISYCDTDKIDAKDRRVSPHFLPDWNPDLQLSTGYIFTGVMCNAALVKRSGVRSSTIAGIVSELWIKLPHSSVEHIPYTLIHRSPNKKIMLEALADIRTVVESFTSAAPSYNEELAVNTIQWPVESEPLVSLIIPTKNGKALVKACIESILEKTVYQNYEILLIDNGSDEKESLDYFAKLEKHSKIRVLRYPGAFNYSAINNFGVQHACKTSSIIGLINNDIEVINPYWLTSMVGHAVRDDIGCVGAKLLYSDGRIQHAGVVLGYGGGAGHAHKYFPRYHPGYIKRLIATQNYSAVTAACLLVKKSLFVDVNGLNEQDLTVAFNDVDFCLRVKETGVRNVYCAEAELYHHESVSRGLDHAPEKAARFNRELEFLKQQWGEYIKHDPAYSPNLTLMRENFSIKSKEEFSS
ncbi:MAG: glycosyltransferase family 2 protein [Gammaproteobacteria bacterium]|nr:glycosyltransferase family 2 protein [Gammaproteobacteria bacterium]